MKPGLSILAVIVALGLGATIFRDSLPLGNAQAPTTNQSQNATSPAPSAVSTQPIAPLDERGARLQNEQNTIDVVRRFEPGLVFISTFSDFASQDDPLARLYGLRPDQTQREVLQGQGSGFFVNQQGDILTNFHVVGQADTIRIRLLNNQRTFEATVVGKAPAYDLALIRPRNMPRELIRPIPLGESGSVQVGQKAIAMGAPFGLDFTVTEGIISAVDRRIPIGLTPEGDRADIIQRALQTDAAINPGNSGGPLLDSSGRVIGINTQILSPAAATGGTAQSAGVGFAIPIDTAKALLPRLQRANGNFVFPPRIGVTVFGASLSEFPAEVRQQYNLPERGVLVQDVEGGSPAATAGIRGGTRDVQIGNARFRVGGDVIVSADGQTVDGLEDLQAALVEKREGDAVRLVLRRGGERREVTARLTAYSFRNPTP